MFHCDASTHTEWRTPLRKVFLSLVIAAATSGSAVPSAQALPEDPSHPIPLPQMSDTLWRTTAALYENWVSGGWQNSTHAVYSYNDDDLLHRIVYQTWDGSSWTNYLRYTYSYDVQGRNVQVLVEQWEGSWVNSQMTENTYDGEKLLQSLTQAWSGSGWMNSALSTYTYQFEQVYQILNQNWSGGTWVNSTLHTYDYESGLIIETLAQHWSGGAWVNSSLSAYSYIGGLIYQVHTSTWSGSSWTNSSLSTYSYLGDLLSEMLYQSWEGGTWQNYYHQDYTYDANGNNIQILGKSWSGGSWVNSSRITYTWESYQSMEEESPSTAITVNGPFPNPSRQKVALDITLPRPCLVRIDLFDLAGRLLVALHDSPLQEGTHRLEQEVELPPGMYLTRIELAGESVTRSLIILK